MLINYHLKILPNDKKTESENFLYIITFNCKTGCRIVNIKEWLKLFDCVVILLDFTVKTDFI